MCLPILCQEFDELYPEALVSTELACGYIRLIQRIGDRDLPMELWKYSSPFVKYLEWGRHIRSSPTSSPELLLDLRRFVPHWDGFVDGEEQLQPNEFHDVVQWLKASPDPQLDLIERWQGYLEASMHRWGNFSDDQLEARWQHNLEREAHFHGPPQPSDEEVLRCWESVLETINRKSGFETEESDDEEGESSDKEEGLRDGGEEESDDEE
ncbi:hypothetical protein B0H17DRAFT_591465 [Mycena rosella]|uniref:Uncharacterized protein n=1 Tax=Mycena rosella TaxID=1033263 RepID=A0AAD7GE15_MYCRO|nr:hypothetical protein B0H17DRAFT_591465 [Mycena rosella]